MSVFERRKVVNLQIEPKKIDRLSNVVETVSFSDAEFFGLYVLMVDKEFGATYWDWVSDHTTMDDAYRAALEFGHVNPTVRAA